MIPGMGSKQIPIGLYLAQVAKTVRFAFGEALAAEGGSIHTWVILLSLMNEEPPTQSDLAESVGIRGPTLTHHLNAMEKEGLLTRNPLPENRRAHQVSLTAQGIAKFDQLRRVAISFDQKLRGGFSSEDLERLRALLGGLAANVGATRPDFRSDQAGGTCGFDIEQSE